MEDKYEEGIQLNSNSNKSVKLSNIYGGYQKYCNTTRVNKLYHISCDCEFVAIEWQTGKGNAKIYFREMPPTAYIYVKEYESLFFLLKNKRISQFTSQSVSSLFLQYFLVADPVL